jgi:putative drug exporter of the RND superfamily
LGGYLSTVDERVPCLEGAAMTGPLFRLGRLCVRERWLVLGAWLLVFAVLAVWARSVGPDVNDNLTLPGSDSQAATALLEKRFPSQANGMNPVVLRAPKGAELSASRYKQPIDDAVSALKQDPDVRSATSPLTKDGAALLAKDAAIGYIALSLRPSPSELTTDDAERIVALADPARKAGIEVGFGGYLGQKISKPETHLSEAIGLSMAMIVLLATFGAVVAMGLPIFTAVIGLVSGLSIITLLSHVSEVPTVAPTLATMIGLGVGSTTRCSSSPVTSSSGATVWTRASRSPARARPPAARWCSPAARSWSRCSRSRSSASHW